MLKVNVLASSSKGNATLFRNKNTSFLIDCGMTPKYTLQKFNELNFSLNNLNGVVITHSHKDHISPTMLKVLVENEVPIFCTANVMDFIERNFEFAMFYDKFEVFGDSTFYINDFTFLPFVVPHDSEGGCTAFNIFYNGKKVTYATDLAHYKDNILNKFCNSDLIIVESNYDDKMLDNSGRPKYLIDRIRHNGHLSNIQTGEIIEHVLLNSDILPQNIVLGHISPECNTYKIASDNISKVLSKNNTTFPQICQTYKNDISETLVL